RRGGQHRLKNAAHQQRRRRGVDHLQPLVAQRRRQLQQGQTLVELGRHPLEAFLVEIACADEAREAAAVVEVQAEFLAPLLAISSGSDVPSGSNTSVESNWR